PPALVEHRVDAEGDPLAGTRRGLRDEIPPDMHLPERAVEAVPAGTKTTALLAALLAAGREHLLTPLGQAAAQLLAVARPCPALVGSEFFQQQADLQPRTRCGVLRRVRTLRLPTRPLVIVTTHWRCPPP